MMEPSTLRVALVDTGNLVKDILVLKEFWEMTGGKMSGKINVSMSTAEKGGKGLVVFGIGGKCKFYLDGLDRVFEAVPIVIEGLDFLLQHGVSF